MKTRVYVMYRLKDGVSMEDYIHWSVETDQRITPALQSIERFDVFRVTRVVEGETPPRYDIIEAIDVTTVEEWSEGLESEHMRQIQEAWPSFADTESVVMLATEQIPPDGAVTP